MRRLPAIVQNLLEAFEIPGRNEGLIGDLAEEYGLGRSGLWLCRQTLAAIAITVWRDLHMRVIFLSLAFCLATNAGYALMWGFFAPSLEPGNEHGLRDAVAVSSLFLWRVANGWLVGGNGVRGTLAVTYLAALVAFDLANMVLAWATGAQFVHPLSVHLAVYFVTWVAALAGALVPAIHRFAQPRVPNIH